MARVFEALQQSLASEPEYAGRFLQSYRFDHVLELPAGYEPRALPPGPAEYAEAAYVHTGVFTDEPRPYIDADVETEGAGPAGRDLANDELAEQVTAPRPSAPAAGLLPLELSDEFKRLRNAVLLAAETPGPQVLLVCGVEPGDGASFVTSHLGLALAEFDKLQVARFEIAAAASGEIGESAGDSYQVTLQRTEVPNLRVVASPQGNVALRDLLRLCDLPAMMEKLRSRFDYVLIDAPAVTAHPEVALLAAQANGVILVAQQDETKCLRIEAARGALQSAQAKVLGVVLNRRRESLPRALACVV
jgi:protein-tyrosine kinase